MPEQKTEKQTRWLWLSLAIIVLDQGSKWLALQHLVRQQPVVVNRFFNWFLDFNQGAAFSFLSQGGGWQLWLFSAIALAVSAIIVVWLYGGRSASACQAAGLAGILGGALGNVIDRIWHGHVIDFISWHIREYYWPTFNVADTAVCIGAVLFFWGSRDDRSRQ